eukprot:9483900-Pyramimonas_sp.AAC.2
MGFTRAWLAHEWAQDSECSPSWAPRSPSFAVRAPRCATLSSRLCVFALSPSGNDTCSWPAPRRAKRD